MESQKLLVVDDEVTVERLIRQRFRKEIQAGEFEFIFAFDGTEAVEVLKQKHDIDLVITDINMPNMDGLTLLNHIQALNPIAKTIMISAYGDLENIRASMNRGAFDFVTKPIDFEDLRQTMRKTLQFVADIKSALRSTKENQLLKMYVNPSVIGYLAAMDSGAALAAQAEPIYRAGHGCADAASDGESASSPQAEGTVPSTSASPKATAPRDSGAVDPGERIEGTVCFIDVCGFTAISESAPPETITVLLNKYFDEVAESVLAFDGTIDKFMGDAAMVVFTGENHLERAARCCLDVRSRISAYSDTEIRPGILHPSISIGMNTGDMVRGNFGSNRIRRLDYTVIGDTVNTAARLESISKPSEILVTERCFTRLQGTAADSFAFEPLGAVHLRNKANPVMLYRLIGCGSG